MGVVAPDAAKLLDQNTGSVTDKEMDEIAKMAQGEYQRTVRESGPRDYVTMYHPDGSTSIVQLPPLGKTGKGAGDRQRKITHYMFNKLRDGKRWWYASPPEGWQPQETPWRCPVEECTRAGGLKNLLNLWRHIENKHPGEVKLYEGVLKAIQQRLAEATAMDLDSLFTGAAGPESLVSEEDLAAAKFTDASEVLDEGFLATPAVAPETFEPVKPTSFCDCGWEDKSGKGMALHKRRWCPLNKKEEGEQDG